MGSFVFGYLAYIVWILQHFADQRCSSVAHGVTKSRMSQPCAPPLCPVWRLSFQKLVINPLTPIIMIWTENFWNERCQNQIRQQLLTLPIKPPFSYDFAMVFLCIITKPFVNVKGHSCRGQQCRWRGLRDGLWRVPSGSLHQWCCATGKGTV